MKKRIYITESQFKVIFEGVEVSDIGYVGSFHVFNEENNEPDYAYAGALEEDKVGNFGVKNKVNQYDVYVRTNDGGNIPHVHVIRNGEDFETCIKLDAPEYFLHGPYTDTLTSKAVDAFAIFMESRSDAFEEFNISNYYYAVTLWKKNNSKTEVKVTKDNKGNVIVPNYRLLK